MCSPLPPDTYIKSDAFKNLVLDKTSEKQVSKDVLAKRGHSQALTSCVTRKNKFVLLLCFFSCANEILFKIQLHILLAFLFLFFPPKL